MARVTVAVNVRDMTRGDLTRLRRSLNGLTAGINRFTGRNTQRNLSAMQRQFADLDARVQLLRGHIPSDEFARMERAATRMRTAMNPVFGPIGARRLGIMRAGLRDLNREIERIGSGGQRTTRVIRIRARDDTEGGLRSATRRISRWAVGPLRGITGLISGTLRDGIGQGIVGAFRSPTFGTALVVALTAVAAMAGAAMAGVLVLAIGGAFVGLGGFIAAKSKEVTQAWEKEINRLKPMFQQAAEPMIPVLIRAIDLMGQMGNQFAPKLEQALTQAAPMINGFLDRTKVGFQRLGENAWNDLQKAFRVFLVAFGPQWEDFLAEFGKSLGALARTVTEHSSEMAMALRGVLGVINLLIDTINFLANAWVFSVQAFLAAATTLFDMIAMVTTAFFGMIDNMLSGFEAVASAFGFEDEAARAREAFNSVRNEAVGRFQEMSAAVKQMGADMDYNNRKRKLEVDIASWTAELERAKQQLKDVPPSKQSEIRANIDNLTANINRAQGQLNSMRKDYYVRIHAYRVGDWALGYGYPGQAFGGVTGSHMSRAATGGARSNMTLVGESGPELVDLAPGTHVRSNADTRRIMNQGGGGGGSSTLVLQSSGRRVDDLLIEILRDAIHQRGGDPVTVLGGR